MMMKRKSVLWKKAASVTQKTAQINGYGAVRNKAAMDILAHVFWGTRLHFH